MTAPPDLDELRALAERATPGEWRVPTPPASMTCVYADDTNVALLVHDADAAFIAAASPDRVIALLDRLRAAEQRAEAAEARQQLDEANALATIGEYKRQIEAAEARLRRCVEALREISASDSMSGYAMHDIARAALAEVDDAGTVGATKPAP